MKAQPIEIEQGMVQCPNCGGGHLHQTEVMVHQRYGEDSNGVETRVSQDNGIARRQLAADDPRFEGRRDDVAVRLTCEQCLHHSRLIVMQHKGQTHVYMRLEE